MKKHPFLSTLLIIALAGCILIAGCSSNGKTDTASADEEFNWPQTMHFAATGSSGEMKVLSWATIMQASLDDTVIRVVNEAAWTNTYKDMAQAKMVLSQIDKSTMRDCIEALNEYASADGGPWMAGLVWVDSLANTGFMVRGDSNIYTPDDIQPGTRIAIWNDKSATLTPFLSLLAWAGVSRNDVVWVNTGDYDACARAVSEGRADICMAAPVAQAVMEAAAAPKGIRYISLDPQEDPVGAAAFLEISPLYNFGPITVGPDSAIGTWGIVSYKYLASNLSTEEELVYNMAKWLDENYDRYKDAYESNARMTLDDLVDVLQTTYLPVHPGLIRYLTEKGIWNDDYEARNLANTALFQLYIDSYADAMGKASAEGIEVKANNERWIEYWENYKLEQAIPVIRMHISLTQDAATVIPKGYIPANAAPTATAPVTSTAPATTSAEIAFEVISISDAHPGDDVTVTIKTALGAEVTILFTMPNGTASAYPKDNVKIAGADGIITWTWNINSHVPAGEATYTFTVTLNGQVRTVTETRTI